MYKTIRSLTVLAFIASAVACGGESDVGGDESNFTGSSLTTFSADLIEQKSWAFHPTTNLPAEQNLFPTYTVNSQLKYSRISFGKDGTLMLKEQRDCLALNPAPEGAVCNNKAQTYAAIGDRSNGVVGLNINANKYAYLGELPDKAGYAFGIAAKGSEDATVQFELKR